MLKRNRPPLRQTPLKRHTPLRRKPVPAQVDKELAGYYHHGILCSTWTCENCNEYIPHSDEWQLYTAQCHILDKEKYPQVRGHFLNRLHLCLRCHVDWDSSWNKASRMPVFRVAEKLFSGFAHLVENPPAVFLSHPF